MIRASILALAFAVSAPAQERVFGMARLEDGAPWAGATVELLARPVGGDETVGVADRVTVTTDAGGRFAAEVGSVLAYTVWAWQATGAGRYRVSEVAEDVIARQPVLLPQRAGSRRFRPLTIVAGPGVATPLRAVVRAATRNLTVVPIPAGADTLPALPPVRAELEVLDAHGLPVARVPCDPASDAPLALTASGPMPVRPVEPDVFPPPDREVVVRGRILLAPDRPAAGAWVVGAVDGPDDAAIARPPALRTGADGRFELAVPGRSALSPRDLVLGPEHVRGLPAEWRVGLWPVVPGLLPVFLVGAEDVDLGDVDLRESIAVRVRVSDEDGGPAIGATLEILPSGTGFASEPGQVVTADRIGQLTMLLPPARLFAVRVRTRRGGEEAFWWRTGRRSGVEPSELRITARAGVVARGWVIDLDGCPVAGFALRATPVTRLERPPAPEVEVAGAPIRAVPLDGWSGFGPRAAAASAIEVVTDQDGRYSVSLSRVWAAYRLVGRGVTATVVLRADRPPAPVEFKVLR